MRACVTGRVGSDQRGFTVVELVCVLVIICILLVAGMIGARPWWKSRHDREVVAQAGFVWGALLQYRADHGGRFPKDAASLRTSLTLPTNDPTTPGPDGTKGYMAVGDWPLDKMTDLPLVPKTGAGAQPPVKMYDQAEQRAIMYYWVSADRLSGWLVVYGGGGHPVFRRFVGPNYVEATSKPTG
jgi:prepilin-type N-terminal cleavage/methylation domain-containing protein